MKLYESIIKNLKEAADEDIEYICHSDTDANNDNEYFTDEDEAITYAKANPDIIDVVIKVDNNEGTEEIIWEKDEEEFNESVKETEDPYLEDKAYEAMEGVFRCPDCEETIADYSMLDTEECIEDGKKGTCYKCPYCGAEIDYKELNEGNLEPQYSGRKSFYGKAFVNDDNTLVSYGTPIMKINDGKIEMLCRPEHLTQTTIRHIREFMQQNGMDPLPKNKLIKLINNLNEYEDIDDYRSYKKFAHVNDVWDYLEGSNSEEDLKNRIADVDPKKFGSIYYDLHNDGNGATVIIDYQDDNEDYYEKVDVYFNEEDINESDDVFKGYDQALPTVNDGREYLGYNLSDAVDAVEKFYGCNDRREAFNKIKNKEVSEEEIKKAMESFDKPVYEAEKPIVRVATDIEWETDGDKEALKSLPKEVEIPDELDDDDIADYLSDEYGWLVNDLYIEERSLNESESLKESDGVLWSSEITEENFDEDIIKEQYQDYVDNFDTTFTPMSYEEFLDSDWLYNFLEGDFEHQEDYKEWYDYINNFPEDELKKYYQEYLDENKDSKEEPIDYETYKENYVIDNSGDEWDLLQEDFLENVCPMIDKQINNDILIVSGNYNSNYPEFRKSGKGGKFLNKAEDLLDWLSGEDVVTLYYDDNGINVHAADHDGSIGGYLYTLPDDENLLLEIAKATDYYDIDGEDQDILEEFKYDLTHGNIDMSNLRDYEDKFIPIKVSW